MNSIQIQYIGILTRKIAFWKENKWDNYEQNQAFTVSSNKTYIRIYIYTSTILHIKKSVEVTSHIFPKTNEEEFLYTITLYLRIKSM